MADALTLKRTAKNKNFVSLLCLFFKNLKIKSKYTSDFTKKISRKNGGCRRSCYDSDVFHYQTYR